VLAVRSCPHPGVTGSMPEGSDESFAGPRFWVSRRPSSCSRTSDEPTPDALPPMRMTMGGFAPLADGPRRDARVPRRASRAGQRTHPFTALGTVSRCGPRGKPFPRTRRGEPRRSNLVVRSSTARDPCTSRCAASAQLTEAVRRRRIRTTGSVAPVSTPSPRMGSGFPAGPAPLAPWLDDGVGADRQRAFACTSTECPPDLERARGTGPCRTGGGITNLAPHLAAALSES
jgi:hypothetical protein